MPELTSLPPSPLPSGGTSERSCSTQYVFLNYQRRGCREYVLSLTLSVVLGCDLENEFR